MPPRIARRTLEALRARRAEIIRVAAEYGASNIRVFGSVARREDDEKSDVDLLVDMAVREEEGGFSYFGRVDDLKRALTDLLGWDVDILTSGALSGKGVTTRSAERMRQRVLSEVAPL